MIKKQIVFQSKHDECSMEKISPNQDNSHLEKLASGRLSDEIKTYIKKNIEKNPNYVYVLVSALGSGEIWGPNINGDYFPEDQIKKSYKTFEDIGYVFTHHKNKDPEKSKGDILFAHWNPRMHRVELIVKIDRRKAPKVANDIDNGKMWDVSMGCKVPYDICSICGHKARTENDYCKHIKNHRGDVLPDGRQVYMINMNPRFFDISFVYIGADRTAKSLMKIASKLNSSIEDLVKKSDIKKEIKGDIISKDAGHMAAILMQEFERLKPFEAPFPNELLNELAEKPIGNILKSLITLGIVLKPHEFQRLYMINAGEDPDKFEEKGIIIDPNANLPKKEVDFKPFDGELEIEIIKKISPFIEKRSAIKSYLYPRLIKMANERRLERKEPERKRRFPSHKLAVPGVLGASILYKKYLDEIPEYGAEGLDETIKEKPWMLPLVTASSIAAVKGLSANKKIREKTPERNPIQKTAGNLGGRIFKGVPAAYLASNVAGRFGEDKGKILNFIEEHPNLLAMLGVAATNSSEDWEAITNALGELSGEDSLITKTAAEVISPQKPAPDLINEVDELYNKYNNIDKKYDRLESLAKGLVGFQNPVSAAGRGVDVLAGGALKKIMSKI
ncbi:MAG: hypothetical protein ACOCT9_01690 [archaeon]